MPRYSSREVSNFLFGEPPSEAGKKLADLKKTLPKPERAPESAELHERAQELARELSEQLTTRAASSETYVVAPPELPPGLTEAHLTAVREALAASGVGFAERVLPKSADLGDLNEAYVDMMFPTAQRPEDTANGLISSRPDWFDATYINSMREELKTIGGSFVLLDTAIKPKYKDGAQHYGTVEGNDSNADPLLPLFREAFATPEKPNPNRFSHSWDELQNKLIPLAKEKIKAGFASSGLPEVDFEVMLVPAILDNQEMTLNQPISSTTDTSEWTSTPKFNNDGTDTGLRLCAGNSEGGGAGFLYVLDRSYGGGYLGARLAVVFKKLDTGTAA
jgi:hypothetical protein